MAIRRFRRSRGSKSLSNARVIVDSHLRTPLTFRPAMTAGEVPTWLFTANSGRPEERFGVDLIYLNKEREALNMFQYKMLEPEGPVRRAAVDELLEDDQQEWTVCINDQFTDELSRICRFDRDLASNGSHRPNSGAFFSRLVQRRNGICGHSVEPRPLRPTDGCRGLEWSRRAYGLATGVWTDSVFTATN